jgi:hypothetical protein
MSTGLGFVIFFHPTNKEQTMRTVQVLTLVFAGGAFVMSSVTLAGLFVIGKRVKKDVDAGIATATEKVGVVKQALSDLQSVL